MAENNYIINGQIDAIAFGGEGILRERGKVAFVPFTAVGDKITAIKINEKKNFVRAKLKVLHTGGPSRQSPACDLFGQCGGCQLQHITYDEQLKIKHGFVKDALIRVAGLEEVDVLPIVKAHAMWQYRRHIRLHLTQSNDGVKAGFISHDNTQHLAVKECTIFSDDRNIIQTVKEIYTAITISHNNSLSDVALYKTSSGRFVVNFNVIDPKPDHKRHVTAALTKHRVIQGIMWQAFGKYHREGDCDMSFDLFGLHMKYDPMVFVQAHPEQSAKLYLDLLHCVPRPRVQKVLDLYCGIGATSLLLARMGFLVTALELNPHAINLARENQARNSFPQIDFRQGNVDKLIHELLFTLKPDLVVVNPPRVGMSKEVSEALSSFEPKDIAYISCMPATLARDLKAFLHKGYKVTHCQPFDLFPQTTHVETLLYLQR